MSGWDAMPYGMDARARQVAAIAGEQAAAALARAQAGPSGIRLGSGRTIAVIGVGLSGDVTVGWATPLPTDVYEVQAVTGAGLIGTVVFAVKSRTSGSCVLTVTASGLAIAAATTVIALAVY